MCNTKNDLGTVVADMEGDLRLIEQEIERKKRNLTATLNVGLSTVLLQHAEKLQEEITALELKKIMVQARVELKKKEKKRKSQPRT